MKKIIILFYNFLWGNEPIFPDSLPPEGFEFTFDHDRLQEATYSGAYPFTFRQLIRV